MGISFNNNRSRKAFRCLFTFIDYRLCIHRTPLSIDPGGFEVLSSKFSVWHKRRFEPDDFEIATSKEHQRSSLLHRSLDIQIQFCYAILDKLIFIANLYSRTQTKDSKFNFTLSMQNAFSCSGRFPLCRVKHESAVWLGGRRSQFKCCVEES